MNQMNRLLHASFDRFPQLVESRYDQAFLLPGRALPQAVAGDADHQRDRRSERQPGRAVSGNLVGRHLPLGVLLRDRRLFDAVEAEQPSGAALYRAAAAADILTWRQQVLADLETKGVLASTSFPKT